MLASLDSRSRHPQCAPPAQRADAMTSRSLLATVSGVSTSRARRDPSTCRRTARARVDARSSAKPRVDVDLDDAEWSTEDERESTYTSNRADASASWTSSSTQTLALSRATSRPGEGDLFSKYCTSHCEMVARALEDEGDEDALDTRCMIYIRGTASGSTKMRLTRVAAWPPKPSSAGASPSSFSGEWDDAGVGDDDGARSIDWDAPEPTLASQKTFDLPSANAVVACLCFEESLVGLMVVEREAEKGGFSEKQKRFLESSANAFTDAWAMHRNNVVAVAAAYRADQTLGSYLYETRQPLNALRALGGMLKTYLKPDDPAGDMAKAMVQQSDALAELSRQLENALYPSAALKQVRSYRDGGAQSTRRPLLIGDEGGRVNSRSVTVSPKNEMCDITKVLVTLLATSDVIATSGGVTMRATLPNDEAGKATVVRASPMDVRSALAEIIDVALVVSPRGTIIDVVLEQLSQGSVDLAISCDASQVPGSVFADESSHAGLRIARRLVEKVGGRFDVENDESGNFMSMRIRYQQAL